MSHSPATIAELTVDPHDALAAARAAGPVTWFPALDAWVITSRAAAVEAMRDPARFTVDDPRFSTAQVIGPSMLSTDGDAHARHRDPFTGWFSSRDALGDTTEWMRAEADRLIAAIRPDGAAELRSTVAAPLAAGTLAHLLGLDPPGADALLVWYRDIVDAVQQITAGTDPGDAGARAYAALRQALLEATDDGRAAALLGARGELGDDDLVANAAVILFGGIETSEGATANAFWHLHTHPGVLDALRADPTAVSAFVEESLRLEPAAANVDRYATEDMDFHGAAIAAGDYVIVSLAGANRDPEVFAEPAEIRLDRPNRRQHTTFAIGPHACLGIHIARAQTVAAVAAAIEALPDLTFLADGTEAPHGLVFRKPPSITASWAPS